MIPDQTVPAHVYLPPYRGQGRGQPGPLSGRLRDPGSADVAAGGEATLDQHLFVGAKVVRLLDRYEAQMNMPYFDKAVDFG